MTEEIIPQTKTCPTCHGKRGFTGPDGFEPCADCNVGPCASIGERPEPIVNICSAGFVAACNLRVMGGDVTALDALEQVSALLENVKAETCLCCHGVGEVEDPFEEEGTMERCPTCQGQKKLTMAFLDGDATMLFAQIKDLAADLRAALAETKGEAL